MSALPKPNAPVANNRLSSVTAKKQLRRTKLRGQGALAVSIRLLSYRLNNHVLIVPPVGARPAGDCTCDRAATENTKVAGSACSCGQRPAGELGLRVFFTRYADRLQMRVPARRRRMEGFCLQRRTLLRKRLVREEENLWTGGRGGEFGAGLA